MAQRPTPWKNINTIIEEKLYLSNLVAARTKRSLAGWHLYYFKEEHQDAIPAEMPQSGIHHMHIAVEDVDYADLLIHLPSACQFIDHVIRSGGVVLVHDVQGVSRSAAVIAAYLMWAHRTNATKALEHIRRAREQIWPNAGFQEQLVLFELRQYAPSPYNGIYRSWRYKLDAAAPIIVPNWVRVVTSGRIIGFTSALLFFLRHDIPQPARPCARAG
ncbi:protein-tyrosine phosphatase-like protein [Mycena rebaudengoi]|nr:protein-tyrosine phosphatase-like protein [Mycena rebaudengoi]